MVKEKEERNRDFIKAWKEEGLGNKDLATRFNMMIGGVRSLKSRLRKKYPNLYSRMSVKSTREVGKSISSEARHRKSRKISFYLPPEMVRAIKVEAAKRDQSASELAEGWLRKALAEEGVE